MKGIKLIENKKLATKSTFIVEINGNKTKFLAKEILSNGTIKYYPFYEKDGKIEHKYKSIVCISTESKTIIKSGISVNEAKGFGFTSPKGVSNFFYFFQEKFPAINEILITSNQETKIEKTKLILNVKDFNAIEKRTGGFVENKKNESQNLYQSILHKLLPSEIDSPTKSNYVSGTLQSFIDRYTNIKFSKEETEELTDMLINSGLPHETLIAAKTEFDIVYIEDIVNEYKENLKQTTDTPTLEEKWHQFFKKHTWIFSQIFSFPAVFLGEKVNVGGHNITGSKDKIVDFLYRNKINNNIAFIEIKTHLTTLVAATEYRNDLYPVSNQLTGAIIQVLDQKNTLLKNYHTIVGNEAESLNSICVVIAGDTSKYKKKGQGSSFELFRWSNKDVLIIPFNELLEKIENLLDLFKKKKID
ncbi:uncharacterized protein DUF4263 [Flavobacterium sp. 90]|uniref:Shedu immune nuclease family protein n=1 Tax=unclassified Flavobacterium TaxID=196869 RepID=UPI000EAF456C|nr:MULTISPECIES: Shedu immune nuclease family protein [unclassified Flavobacterium]RKR08196.1 uncharacterized protein DUF4263 [Flavobacterium sp. 81]TCK57387.1 uncharacterized protein DUF4263 [Flavobacterium sp. 90]